MTNKGKNKNVKEIFKIHIQIKNRRFQLPVYRLYYRIGIFILFYFLFNKKTENVLKVSLYVDTDWLMSKEASWYVDADWLMSKEASWYVDADWLMSKEVNLYVDADWLMSKEASLYVNTDWLMSKEASLYGGTDWLMANV